MIPQDIFNALMNNNEEKQKVFNSISPKIEVTYHTPVEFIKWYNENK